MCARRLIALDIGGANIKVVTLERNPAGGLQFESASHVFPMWKRADESAAFLKTICVQHPACDVAVTMTAELADVFATKREGVVCVLDAVQQAFPTSAVRVLTVEGKLAPLNNVLHEPLQAAAANWAASAWAAAQIFPEGILGDMGSTTTDLIPFAAGRISAVGKTDPERLLSGELVYTGYLRTPCSHLAQRVPWRGGSCRVSPEYFTIAGDVHLLLGSIHPDDYQWPTPDGRGTTTHDAKARLARLICADTEMLSDDEIMGLARYLYRKQIEQVTEALDQVLSHIQQAVPLFCAGSGRFLLQAAAAQVGLKAIDLAKVCGEKQAEIFPAWSLCMMLAAEQEGMKVFEQFRSNH
jgi:probable H4MPT-linked C1 transfer pathway protein